MIEYWKKVKETIHVFDIMVARYIIQGFTLLGAPLSISAFVTNSSPFAALILAAVAVFAVFPIATQAWFYTKLLSESIDVAKLLETSMFQDSSEEYGLTIRLTRISQTQMPFRYIVILPFLCIGAIAALMVVMIESLALMWVSDVRLFMLGSASSLVEDCGEPKNPGFVICVWVWWCA
jgi:hypothetical protein